MLNFKTVTSVAVVEAAGGVEDRAARGLTAIRHGVEREHAKIK
jgi:hypothetical protein